MTELADYIGKTVLIGLTHCEADGTLIGHEQMVGTITAFTEKAVEVTLDGGQLYYLPPDTRPFHVANPGEYRLRATGQVVLNPDYICTYTVNKPSKN